MTEWHDLARLGVATLANYEPGRPIEDVAREFGFTDPDQIIKLASNENALGPSPRAVLAMRAAAGQMHLYPDGGTFALRDALARHLDLVPESILPGNGSNELIELLGHVFLGPGTSLVMADCAFVVYRLVAAMFGAQVIAVPMRQHTHHLPALAAAVRPDTRLVFVANPNNPTSTCVSPAEIDAFMARISPDVIVCFDEAYVELLPPSRQPNTLHYVREGRKVVVLRTFSKTYGLAGLRVGYAAAPPACIALLNRIRQPFNVSAMAQVAAVAALEDVEHVERTRRMVADGLAYLQREFEAMEREYVPASANFILVHVGQGRAVFESLMRLGVIVRPMDGYGLPHHVRVTVGTAAENERLVRGLREVLGTGPGRSGL
ncbi:MAG: histidinol-phosphate transaminase [Lentisphaerae bacterium]|nr:histidinol-phosphate transaminase [Lentisphaerota bacterium]